jgi:PAS domain S-box-containing protein
VGISLTVCGGSVLANTEHARITGVPVAESSLPGAFARASHPEDYAKQLAEAEKFQKNEEDHYTVEKRYLHPDGRVQWAELTSRFFTDPSTEERRIVTILIDLTERKEAEAALRETLQQKEALLHEVHHRVKNNLQVISSLLSLEARRDLEPSTKAVLQEMKGRIRSMALLHETLYRTKNFARVDLAGYLQEVAVKLFRSQNANPGAVRLVLELAAAEVELDQAMPCGLLINELLTNTLKHAFPDGRHGEVRLGLQQTADGRVHLQVGDDGVGLPADLDLKNTQTLGLQLVTDLTKQLQGTLELGPGPGASFSIVFTPKAAAGTAPPLPPAGQAQI